VICLLGLLVALWVPPAAAKTADTKPLPRIVAIDQLAQSAMQELQLAGLSIAVRHKGRLVHAAGYGLANIELAAPATPYTVYRIGSITKQFTSALALRMAQQNKIALDAPIGRYLPELKNVGDVTVRQLLNHTSGLASFDAEVMPDAFLDRSLAMSKSRMIEYIDAAPRDFPAGSRFKYSNSGYLLVGLALERISGLEYPQLLDRELLSTNGLSQTRYDVPEQIVPERASGYVGRNDKFINAEWNSPTRPFAAGALLSTAMDLLRWNDRLYGGELLSPEALAAMIRPGQLADGREIPYGLGVRILPSSDGLRIAHGGLIVGFSAFLSHYPTDNLDIAILTNTQDRGKALGDLEARIAALIRNAGL
jgi:CubicO group peptidase (beta-lactamase class C family)